MKKNIIEFNANKRFIYVLKNEILSQKLYNKKKIAEKLGISQQLLSNILNERMGVSTSILHKFFIYCNISADYFFETGQNALQKEIPKETQLLEERIEELKSHNMELKEHIQDLRRNNKYLHKILD